MIVAACNPTFMNNIMRVLPLTNQVQELELGCILAMRVGGSKTTQYAYMN
jgi:hypothetical protein